MPASILKYIKRCAEFRPKEELQDLPGNTRGIYALLRFRPKLDKYDVVYIGMSAAPEAGIRGRLKAHSRSPRKSKLWTHFSAFEVWPNITQAEVEELEGLLRHIYRKDSRANRLGRQKRFKKLRAVREDNLKDWQPA